MNILFLQRRISSSSGIDVVTRILANEFVNLGHNVNLCSMDFSDKSIDSKVKHSYIFGDWRKINTLQNINIVKNIVEKENVNIIINQECQNIPWAKLAKKSAKNSNAKIISCLHFPILMSINHFGKRARFFPIFFVRFIKKYRDLRNLDFAYNNSDLLVFLSEKFLDHYRELQPKKDFRKLRAIANPFDSSFKTIDFEKKQKTILFVGRISEFQKRLSLIIEMWKIILSIKKYNEWNLKIVGDGKDLEDTKKKANGLDRIYFEGYQKADVYFEKASIFLMTSAFEGFGMTVVEAQKYACVPVAMDSYLSLSDIIENGKNGIISPDNDIQAFARNIMLLMNNEQMRRNMGKNGMKSVEKFSKETIIQKWEKLFNELRE